MAIFLRAMNVYSVIQVVLFVLQLITAKDARRVISLVDSSALVVARKEIGPILILKMIT